MWLLNSRGRLQKRQIKRPGCKVSKCSHVKTHRGSLTAHFLVNPFVFPALCWACHAPVVCLPCTCCAGVSPWLGARCQGEPDYPSDTRNWGRYTHNQQSQYHFYKPSCCLGTPVPSFRTQQVAVPRGVPLCFHAGGLGHSKGSHRKPRIRTAYPTNSWLI